MLPSERCEFDSIVYEIVITCNAGFVCFNYAMRLFLNKG